MSTRTRRLTGATIAGIAALAMVAAPSFAGDGNNGNGKGNGKAGPNGVLNVQLLSFNDFHGNLEPPSGSSGRITTSAGNVDAGGVEYLATHLAQARQGHPASLTVAAGDIVGASPLLSAAFHDEPTILAMNKLGLDATAVGNHEFDEGYKEIQRLQNGGCIDDGDGANNQNSCPAGPDTFPGASFDILAANVVENSTGRTILPAYTVKDVDGAKIGFIGMTLKDTPNIVTAAGVAGLTFTDEVKTANALVPVLKKQGVNAIVVLIHQGGLPSNPIFDSTCGNGGELVPGSSPIIDIAKNLDPEIDMVISGHTHQPYVCNILDPAGKPRLVTSASSFGRLYTETEFKYNYQTRDILRDTVTSNNMIVSRDVPKNAAQSALIAQYQDYVRPIASKVIGHINKDVTRDQNPGGESQLGDLIADAQLADPSVVTGGDKPVIAFMNPGGIRADLTAGQSSYGEALGDVTFSEAFTVQPFSNYLVSLSLTGAQIKDLLKEQWSGLNKLGKDRKILQVSEGFAYAYDTTTGALGEVTLDGKPLDDNAAYRVVTNNFLQGGGDGFPTFTKGTNVYYGGLDIDAFANYLSGVTGGYTPGPLTRITGN